MRTEEPSDSCLPFLNHEYENFVNFWHSTLDSANKMSIIELALKCDECQISQTRRSVVNVETIA
jgi:hypothetical protein